MDEDLEKLRREVKAAPHDLSAALRLAAAAERAGEVGEAWTAILALGPKRLDAHGERRGEALVALGGIARRNPAALLEHFRGLGGWSARHPLEALARSGELAVPVTLACDRNPPDDMLWIWACHALAITCAPSFGVDPRRVPRPDEFRSQIGFLNYLPMHDDGNPLGPWRIIERARKERLLALAPWLQAMFKAPATAVATDAKLCFLELTGQRDAPLDVTALAAHEAELRRAR